MTKNNKLYTLILATLIAATPVQSKAMFKSFIGLFAKKKSVITLNDVVLAITTNDIPALKKIITKQFSLNSQSRCGQTVLHYAVRCNNLKAAELFLKNGIDPCIEDNNGSTALIMAIHTKNSKKMMQLLLGSGINPDSKNKYGSTPLEHATISENVDAIKQLFKHGADS